GWKSPRANRWAIRSGPERRPGPYRTAAVADPAAPGGGVDARAFQAGQFHRQQVVAGGDAGAAVQHRLRRRPSLQQGFELAPKFGGGTEAAIGRQVLAEGAVEGAGDVAGDRIQRLLLAAVALGGAGI